MEIIDFENLLKICVNSKKLICLDWGQVNVGVAVSDFFGIIASPLCTVSSKKKDNEEYLVGELVNIILKENPVAVVIGMPINMDGSFGFQTKRVEEFASKIYLGTKKPVFFKDERLSSLAVERSMLDADITRNKRKKNIDKNAAAYVLQGVLDSMKMKNMVGDDGLEPPTSSV